MNAPLLAMPRTGTVVEVYRNRTRHCWSVRDVRTKRRLGHALDLVLADATFLCSEAGRLRSQITGRRFVYAVVRGTLAPDSTLVSGARVRFDPHRPGAFFCTYGPQPLSTANFARFERAGHVTVSDP